MKISIGRLRTVFLIAFGVICAGLWAWQLLYEMPKKRCEGHGFWWASEQRVCGRPIYLPTITHRPVNLPPLDPNKAPKAVEAPKG